MNTAQARFYIDKYTGTFSDELVAAGWMRVLAEVLQRQHGRVPEVTLRGRGAYYEVTCEPPLDREALLTFEEWLFPAPFVRTRNNEGEMPADLPAEGEPFLIDFERERERRGTYFEAFKALPQTARRAYARGDTDPALDALPPGPHPDWHILRAVNTPTALTGYNNLIERWYSVYPQTGRALLVLCDLFRETPNDPEKARKAWRKLAKKQGWKVQYGGQATASQLYNPSQGKGINKSKANSATLGNLKNLWLLEWLKAVGMYEGGLTRALRDSNDRKSYVVAPGQITRQAHREIMAEFHNRMRFSETAVRSDVFTVLRYLEAFIDYVELARQGEVADAPGWLVGQVVRASSVIHGFHVAFYKDMGNAQTTMNLSFLNLPGWVTISGQDDIITYREILEEHEQIVSQLQEDRGEELELLERYRDFIVADHMEPFFEFTNRYSGYLISQRERRSGYARQFRTDNIRRLLMSNDEKQYRPILDNEGFQNVAYAIRQSTVTAQWRKGEGDRRYDVRYGLGQELARKSQYEDQFIAALSDFLQKYNAENAMVMENREGPYRRSIRTGDIEEIVGLIDEYGSDLICKLLVAYGYAREPRKETAEGENGANGS